MASKFIKVWDWENAPEKYRDLSLSGGDEDWVVFVPSSYSMNHVYISWLDFIDSMREPELHFVPGGAVYIGSHS